MSVVLVPSIRTRVFNQSTRVLIVFDHHGFTCVCLSSNSNGMHFEYVTSSDSINILDIGLFSNIRYMDVRMYAHCLYVCMYVYLHVSRLSKVVRLVRYWPRQFLHPILINADPVEMCSPLNLVIENGGW